MTPKERPTALLHALVFERSPSHRLIQVLVFSLLVPMTLCFTSTAWKQGHAKHCRMQDFARAAQKKATVDLQSDDTLYGRGEMHLSAALEDDDVVVYQTGSWTVDGVEVGDGSPSRWRYARVENIQIIWTHNCEHGVIRGVALDPIFSKDKPPRFSVAEEQVEFGPEQLVARIPTEWNGGFHGLSLVNFDESLWNSYHDFDGR